MTDKEEFCRQIKLNEKSMYSLAYSMVRNEHDAADIISEAILKAYSKLDTLKNKDAFKSWLLKIVHNTAAAFIRKNSRVIYLDDVKSICEESCEEDTNSKLTLNKAVASLPSSYRKVITLYYYEDLSTFEIAKITNQKETAVRQQLTRARKQLKEMLKEDFM